jgi:WD40 repeat protein
VIVSAGTLPKPWDSRPDIRSWDAATGQPIGQLTGPMRRVYTVATGRPAGRDAIAAGSNDHTVQIWDAVTGQPLVELSHPDLVHAVAVGQAGGRDIIVAGIEDHTVGVWDRPDGSYRGRQFHGHTDAVTAVAIGRARGHDVTVSGSLDCTVHVWNPDGTVETVIDMAGPVNALYLSDDGRLCATTENAICLFDS